LFSRNEKLSKGNFRVIVFESDGKKSINDFSDLISAKVYADDAASETENGPVYSTVFDDNFNIIYYGEHY
jgi:hypothetical protein